MSSLSFLNSMWRVSRGSMESMFSIITFIVASAAAVNNSGRSHPVASNAISAVPPALGYFLGAKKTGGGGGRPKRIEIASLLGFHDRRFFCRDVLAYGK